MFLGESSIKDEFYSVSLRGSAAAMISAPGKAGGRNHYPAARSPCADPIAESWLLSLLYPRLHARFVVQKSHSGTWCAMLTIDFLCPREGFCGCKRMRLKS